MLGRTTPKQASALSAAAWLLGCSSSRTPVASGGRAWTNRHRQRRCHRSARAFLSVFLKESNSGQRRVGRAAPQPVSLAGRRPDLLPRSFLPQNRDPAYRLENKNRSPVSLLSFTCSRSLTPLTPLLPLIPLTPIHHPLPPLRPSRRTRSLLCFSTYSTVYCWASINNLPP